MIHARKHVRSTPTAAARIRARRRLLPLVAAVARSPTRWPVAPGGSGAVRIDAVVCPGRKPPFWDIKRPTRFHKRAIQKRFAMEDARAA